MRLFSTFIAIIAALVFTNESTLELLAQQRPGGQPGFGQPGQPGQPGRGGAGGGFGRPGQGGQGGQGGAGGRPGQTGQPGQSGRGGAGGAGGGFAPGQMRLPPIPVLMALDVDRNGEISTKEIEAAAQALRKLDRNRDGKLTTEELMPQFGRGGAGGAGVGRPGPGGQGGAGGRPGQPGHPGQPAMPKRREGRAAPGIPFKSMPLYCSRRPEHSNRSYAQPREN